MAQTDLPEKTKRPYSDDEIQNIYQLGRFHLENGNLTSAEPIMKGLSEIAPENPLGWLGLAYVNVLSENYQTALESARKAAKGGAYAVQGMLFEVASLLSLNDLPAAGTVLGEIGDRVDAGEISDPNILRFYRAQLARYQGR